MMLRGNYKLFYLVEFLTGLLLILLFNQFGDFGLFGLILFFIALFLTQKAKPDEREIFLIYQISSFEGIIIGTSIAVIYFFFPDINWFYSLICISLITRGIIGFITFKSS